LFQQAISESSGPPQYLSQSYAISVASQLVNLCSCVYNATNTLTCMQAVTATTILTQSLTIQQYTFGQAFSPSIDGSELTDMPINLINQGTYNKVPVIFGINLNEGTIFSYGTFGQCINRNLYPSANYDNSSNANIDCYSDLFICPTRSAVVTMSTFVKTYTYQFAQAPSYGPAYLLYVYTGAFHGSELGYVFGNPPSTGSFTTTEQQLSTDMINYWTSFAETGNPNNGQVSTIWSPVSSNSNLNSLYFVTGGTTYTLNPDYNDAYGGTKQTLCATYMKSFYALSGTSRLIGSYAVMMLMVILFF